jgi:hypothetical protein
MNSDLCTAQCEYHAELLEERIEREKWLAENECGYPECHRLDGVHVCRALGCIAMRCPVHMTEFMGKWVCEDCLVDLEELVAWLEAIHAGNRTDPTPGVLRATAILNYWNSQTARNQTAGCAEPEKGEVNREYIPAQ